MKRVLLTGGRGFIGRALLPALLARKYHVVSAERNAHVDTPFDDPRIQHTASGNIGPQTEWARALEGVDTVIHLAGRAHVMRDTARDPLAEFRRVNVEATERLARQAVEAGVRRFIFTSSIGVHGSTTGIVPVTETSPIHPDKDYGRSKWDAECVLQRIRQETGLELVIVRPPLVYGPHVRGNFLRLLRWADKALPLPLGAIRNRRSFIGIDNLVDFLAECVENPRAVGEAFVISDGEDLSTPELIKLIARHLNRPYRMFPAPVTLLRSGLRALGRGEDADRLFASLTVDAAKARETLDWRPPAPLDRGIQRMCVWYRDEGRSGKAGRKRA